MRYIVCLPTAIAAAVVAKLGRFGRQAIARTKPSLQAAHWPQDERRRHQDDDQSEQATSLAKQKRVTETMPTRPTADADDIVYI